MLNSIKTKREQGFTIVELLIVIVVIAILAAITIVAYTGINNRAKTSNAQTAANQVAKKAGAYNAVKGSYPENTAAFETVNESKLEGGVAIAATVDSTNGEKSVAYTPCGTTPNFTGAHVAYFDYNASALTTDSSDPKWITVGTC